MTVCEWCGRTGCHWTKHADARAEVEARGWESWDDREERL